ncbi:hypothetical protein V497_07448 [Pseudogymnoascus sp. VKM F-4516 (FW-969)]|nr:hypothetical protein V497_07448 [Pseudogymnoascus sp. VKM F-4516 (FW-969)]
MDPMDIDKAAGPPPTAKRVAFQVPSGPEDPKKRRTPPPQPSQPPQLPAQLADTTTSPITPIPPATAVTPATPVPATLRLLSSIFLPFHGVPAQASSTPLTRETTLVQTIDNLALQDKAMKRLQIHLALQERDRILATERSKARAAEEGATREVSPGVTSEEMDAIQSRLAARPDPKKSSRELEHRGGDWIRDPEEREKWKREKGEELGYGVAEKLLALTAEAAAKMKVHEMQSQLVVEGKKRALESERKRLVLLEMSGGE